jgi:hypothetical protein
MSKASINIFVQVFVWTCFQFIWINTKVKDCWITWKEHVLFCKKPTNSFPKWLYHLAFLPTINENSYIFISIWFDCQRSGFGALIDVWWWPIVLTCVSWMIHDTEHPFIGLFAIFVSSSVLCLSALAHF